MAKRSALPFSDQPGRALESPAAPSNPHPTVPEPSLSVTSNPRQRITRSAARLAAENPSTNPLPPPPPPPPPLAPPANTTPSRTRKRKAPTRRAAATDNPELNQSASPQRGAKRVKIAAQTQQPTRQSSRQAAAMPQQGSSKSTEEQSKASMHSASSSRPRSSRQRKPSRGDSIPQAASPPRRQRKRGKRDNDVVMKDSDPEPEPEADQDDEKEKEEQELSSSNESQQEQNPADIMDEDDDDDDEVDPFRSGLFGGRTPFGLQSTLRALSGMMSGLSSRLRDILVNLKMKEDPSIQLIALQELSDLLLVSNEDNLAGQFSSDAFVKELVTLMQPSEFGEENPEIMLLACRSLANLMEAIRGSVANVVHGGAVPVLCQKLLDIQFIDLAEQALSTLAKISVDFPASIVREGGLTACLTYLDFFPTSTQRTAVTTAANCCRNLPGDSFPVVRDVMPTLLHVLSSSDQKVVEQGCLCVCRVVESFKYKPEKLEELIEPDMLRAILRLLLPGTTNLIGPHIHTHFLRILAIISKSSPRLSVELLKMNVVDTLYQILTGISPPSEESGKPIKSDSVHIMQALIHRPREQVYETLNVIYELLPGGSTSSSIVSEDHVRSSLLDYDILPASSSPKAKASVKKRLELLKECKPEIKRFATVLLPTLTDTYSSTVNLRVRQKVLLAQLKMLQDLDAEVIEEALRAVPYASFLAGILSQKDHLSLVTIALQCAELLFQRLRDIYQYQFHREGVITEITKLADLPLSPRALAKKSSKPNIDPAGEQPAVDQEDKSEDENAESNDDEGASDDEDIHNDDYLDDQDEDDMSESDDSSMVGVTGSKTFDEVVQDLVISCAKEFLQIYEGSKGKGMHKKALKVLEDLRDLVTKIQDCYKSPLPTDGYTLFSQLASYFDGDALESITSFELLNSGIISVLLDVLENHPEHAGFDFLRAFTTSTPNSVARDGSSSTCFGEFIHKLQDLLSRTEHFEVITVNHNSFESRSTLSMLSKQMRLRLVAEDDTDLPKHYKNMMVSIHAIANFKSLDDYLRPRISISERPRGSRQRGSGFSQAPGGSQTSTATPSRTGDSTLTDPDSSSSQPARRGIPGGGSRNTTRLPSRLNPNATFELQRGSNGSAQEALQAHRRSERNRLSSLEDDSDDTDEPLECADERQITDDDEEIDDDEEDGLDTIVDDLEDELSDDDGPDPTAVNMEIASSGKVTARNEDGTRIATPQNSTPAAARASSSGVNTASRSLNNPLALGSRSFASYAAAMMAIPQDWHLEFSIGGKPISSDTTIYRAIHYNGAHLNDNSNDSIWSAAHTIQFKRVPGPPTEPNINSSSSTLPASEEEDNMPASLSKVPTTASILQLLRVLHMLNSRLGDILAGVKGAEKPKPEPLTQFINTKLTAKLNRQLEEPLIVASNCLPSWSEDLGRHFPFLFPFETRHLFLQSTSFGYARSIMRWQGSQSAEDSRRDQRRDDRAFSGRLQRQKVRISRTRILESAMKVLDLYGSSSSVLEIEYFEEVGTGLGPTLEFYSTVSREFSKKNLKLWRDHDSRGGGEYVQNKSGLFPAPMGREQAAQESGKKALQHFKSLGKFVARSMLDSRIIDVGFNPAFFRMTGGYSKTKTGLSIEILKSVDPELANSLTPLKQFADKVAAIEKDDSMSAEQKTQAIEECDVGGVGVEELGLDFTLPGYPDISLVKNGSNVAVGATNVGTYVKKVIDMTIGGGVQLQMDAFRSGFSQVFQYSALQTFTPAELVMLFGQVEEDWSLEALTDSIKADHGFNLDSRSVRNLLETMSEFTIQQRRDFLQFVTGSPKLPIGGFKSLTPMFTVVCRPSDPPYTSDDYLPSVMTCVNYLKLPDYSTSEILREKLGVAMQEGQGAFHLS